MTQEENVTATSTDAPAAAEPHKYEHEIPKFTRGEPGFTDKLNQLSAALEETRDYVAKAPAIEVADEPELTGAAKSAATRKRKAEIEAVVRDVLAEGDQPKTDAPAGTPQPEPTNPGLPGTPPPLPADS